MSVTDDEVSGYDLDLVSTYPLQPMSRAEAVTVVAFGMHRPERRRIFDDTEGVRAGFTILAVMTGGLGLLGVTVVALFVWVKP